MKFTKKLQYGLLFGLYLARAGRVSAKEAAGELGLSKALLEQVAHKLTKAGVLRSVRGPVGGYELLNEPKVYDFIQALQPLKYLDYGVHKSQEYRALGNLSIDIAQYLYPSLNQSIREVMQDLINQEVKHFSKLDAKGVLNQ